MLKNVSRIYTGYLTYSMGNFLYHMTIPYKSKGLIRESAKKFFFLVARPIRGGGGKGLATKKK